VTATRQTHGAIQNCDTSVPSYFAKVAAILRDFLQGAALVLKLWKLPKNPQGHV
jgi:hypothetical protein